MIRYLQMFKHNIELYILKAFLSQSCHIIELKLSYMQLETLGRIGVSKWI